MLKGRFSIQLVISALVIIVLTMAGYLVLKYKSQPVIKSDENQVVKNIKFYYTSTENSDSDKSFKSIIDSFNKSHKDIKVEGFNGVSVDKQLISIMSGNSHDISYNLWPNAIRWAQNGLLEPLDPYMERDNFDIEDFLPATMDIVKYDDTIYSIPFYVQTMALYYNVDMLKKAGYDHPPRTLNELKEMNKKLTVFDENGDITRMGFMPDYPWIDNVLWPILFGAEFYNHNTNEVTTTQPEYIEAIEFQNSFYKEIGWDRISKFKLGFGSGEQEPFYSNKLAMVMGGDWVSFRAKHYAPELNYGISPFPYPGDKPELKNTSMISASVMCMTAGSKKKAEAWEFLKHLVSKESLLKYAVENECPMARKSVLNNPEIRDNPDLELLTNFILSGNIRGFTPLPIVDEYLGTLTEQTELVFKQKKSAYDAMKSVKQEIDKLLKK